MELARQGLKSIVRWVTGLTEIERTLLTSQEPAALRRSLNRSRSLRTTLSDTTAEEPASLAQKIQNCKTFHPRYARLSTKRLETTLHIILAPKRVAQSLNQLKSTKYSKSNQKHEAILLELWNLLKPDSPLPARRTDEWQKIGFQADDPATDFRGPGVLGLALLYYCAKFHTQRSATLLQKVDNLAPEKFFFFAAAGINVAAWLVDNLDKFASIIEREGELGAFEIFSEALLGLGERWIASGWLMMEFNTRMPQYLSELAKSPPGVKPGSHELKLKEIARLRSDLAQ